MDTEVPTKSIALSDELKETDKVQRDVHADCSEGDVDDSPCQPDAVNIDSQYVCESALQDYSIKPFITSTENVDGSLSFFNDSCYEGSDPPNQSSSAANLTSSPANSPISPTPRSLDLVAIYIPFDDAEDQGNSESVYNPLLMDTATAVHNAQNADDVKEVNTKQLQTHAPTTQESQTISSTKETVEVHSLSDDTNNAIENFDTDIIRTKGLSPVISDSEDILELPLTKKISPRKSISVTINIPQAGSGGMPTLAENTGTYDQYIYPNCVESIELQRNPAYVTISDGCTNGTIDEVVKLERNPAYVTISDQCTNGIIDEAIILERNPAYIPIDHTSSEIHLYEEIPYTTAPITSTSSNTSDATIKMEKNPAYHCTTINYAGSLIQKHSTK